MNNECDKFTNQILSQSGKLDDAAQKHIESCDDCRMMLETWQGLKNVKKKNPTPPMSADFIIQREAQRVASNRLSFTKSYKRWAALAAMAACAVFICWISITQIKRNRRIREQNAPTPMEQMIAQNVLNPKPVTTNTTRSFGSLNQKASQPAKALNWENLDLNEDFFEIETEIEYCHASI